MNEMNGTVTGYLKYPEIKEEMKIDVLERELKEAKETISMLTDQLNQLVSKVMDLELRMDEAERGIMDSVASWIL